MLIGLLMCCYSAKAQINVKVGYNVVSPSFSEVNDLLASYSPTVGEVSKSFGDLAFMHGIGLGLRYRLGETAIEVDWSSVKSEKTALSYVASADRFDELSYDYGLKGFSLGLDRYFGVFGIGSAISSTNFNIKRSVGNNQLAISSESKYQLQLRLIWQIQQSDQVSLELRPYYQFALGDYSLRDFAAEIGNPNDINVISRPSLFGLSLVFYNGRH